MELVRFNNGEGKSIRVILNGKEETASKVKTLRKRI